MVDKSGVLNIVKKNHLTKCFLASTNQTYFQKNYKKIDIKNMNISQICKDIFKTCNFAENSLETKTKLSFSLAGRLLYGVTIIFRMQTQIIYEQILFLKNSVIVPTDFLLNRKRKQKEEIVSEPQNKKIKMTGSYHLLTESEMNLKDYYDLGENVDLEVDLDKDLYKPDRNLLIDPCESEVGNKTSESGFCSDKEIFGEMSAEEKDDFLDLFLKLKSDSNLPTTSKNKISKMKEPHTYLIGSPESFHPELKISSLNNNFYAATIENCFYSKNNIAFNVINAPLKRLHDTLDENNHLCTINPSTNDSLKKRSKLRDRRISFSIKDSVENYNFHTTSRCCNPRHDVISFESFTKKSTSYLFKNNCRSICAEKLKDLFRKSLKRKRTDCDDTIITDILMGEGNDSEHLDLSLSIDHISNAGRKSQRPSKYRSQPNSSQLIDAPHPTAILQSTPKRDFLPFSKLDQCQLDVLKKLHFLWENNIETINMNTICEHNGDRIKAAYIFTSLITLNTHNYVILYKNNITNVIENIGMGRNFPLL